MTWDEVQRTADAFKMGVLPMKAVAWQLHLYHEVEGGKAEARELSKLCGSTENSASRALQSIRIYANTQQKESIYPNRKDTDLSKVTHRHNDTSSLRKPPAPHVSPPHTPPLLSPSPERQTEIAPACEEPADREPGTDPGPADPTNALGPDDAAKLGERVCKLTRDTWCQQNAEEAALDGRWPSAWIIEAATKTGMANPDRPWPYMQRILFGFVRKGGSDSEREFRAARAEAATLPPTLPIRASPDAATPATSRREQERLARIAEWESDDPPNASARV